MGKHPGEFKLRIGFFSIFFAFFFFFSAKMNLTVFAGILLAVTMATARRASLGEKTMQAAEKADEPEEAMRESASLVEKIMRAADEADEPAGAKRGCLDVGTPCRKGNECCYYPDIYCLYSEYTAENKGQKAVCQPSRVMKN